MIEFKDMTIKTLIESNEGVHLSAYISYDENKSILKQRIKKSIQDATFNLTPVLSPKELELFLLPINRLIDDDSLLNGLKDNIGIFRTARSFKILSIPTQVNNICVVADSFHVKPILRWIQTDKSFMLLGVTDKELKLFRVSMGRFSTIDTIQIDGYITQEGGETTSRWIESLLAQDPSLMGLKLFIAGDPLSSQKLLHAIKYAPKFKNIIHPIFTMDTIKLIASKIRYLMKIESQKSLEDSLAEYYLTEDRELTQDNLFKISKAAVEGKIKKLIISDSINIFGKLCKKTGELTVHFDEKDHEDDDVLDDLAQTVLLNGGKILLAQRDQLPEDYPALAILEPNEIPLPLRLLEDLGYPQRSAI